jgi:hypothetical protein
VTRHIRGIDRGGAACALLVAAAWLAGVQLESVDTGFLLLAPCFALAVALLLGRYPGEQLLAKQGRDPKSSPRRLRLPTRPRWSAPTRRTNGGLLMARSLAGRAPPLIRRPQRARWMGARYSDEQHEKGKPCS